MPDWHLPGLGKEAEGAEGIWERGRRGCMSGVCEREAEGGQGLSSNRQRGRGARERKRMGEPSRLTPGTASSMYSLIVEKPGSKLGGFCLCEIWNLLLRFLVVGFRT